MDTVIHSLADAWITSCAVDGLFHAGVFGDVETEATITVDAQRFDEEYLQIALRMMVRAGFAEAVDGTPGRYRLRVPPESLQAMPEWLCAAAFDEPRGTAAAEAALLQCLQDDDWSNERQPELQAQAWRKALLFAVLPSLLRGPAEDEETSLAICSDAVMAACRNRLDELGWRIPSDRASATSMLSTVRHVLVQAPLWRALPALLSGNGPHRAAAVTAYEDRLRHLGGRYFQAESDDAVSALLAACADDQGEETRVYTYPEHDWVEKIGTREPAEGKTAQADQLCSEVLRATARQRDIIVSAWHASPATADDGFSYDSLPQALYRRYLSSAPAFLMSALDNGLFPARDGLRLIRDEQGHVRCSVFRLRPRPYRVRHPRESDLPDLFELDRSSQPEAMHTPDEELRRRVLSHPHSILVLEQDERIMAALYAQRMDDLAALEHSTYAEVGKLRREDGRFLQLLGLYVRPEMADRGYADALIDAMLTYAATLPGIQQVIGVTRCASYREQRNGPLQQYIQARNELGEPLDPMLHFHVSHGALIERVLAGFRPADRDNQGAGILVRYDVSPSEEQKSVPAPGTALKHTQRLATLVSGTIQKVLGEARACVYDECLPLMSMGLASLELLELRRLLSAAIGQPLEATFFFRYGTPEAIIAHLAERFEETPALAGQSERQQTAAVPAEAHGHSERIAIIGMGCRLPGGIATPEQLYQALLDGRDLIGPLPDSRRKLHDEKGAFRWPGGFLEDIDGFDAAFFRISPREAEWIDPQQRLLLEVAWETLESAAIAPSSLRGSRSGIFVGMMGSDYASLLSQVAAKPVDAYFSTGNACSVAAGRLAYLLDWQGPALTIDTACSSSLVAVHNACRSLVAGECDLALAAGVNLLLDARRFEAFADAGMLSADGRCKTFDDSANGYGRSEGCVVIALKRLADAEAAGDRIVAVIEATAINQDGASSGLTAPNQQAQERLITSALRSAGVRPNEIAYLEAHGTGTSLGDPIEVMAAAAVLGSTRDVAQPLLIGSVKSALGHLEAAAGITGLVATAMKMQHRTLPGQLNFTRPNRHIPWADLPVRVVERTRPWPGFSELACISSFGFSGTNAHAVLRAHNGKPAAASVMPGPVLIVLSARTETDLRAMARRLYEHLLHSPEYLPDLARTLQLGRDSMACRLALIVSSTDALMARLKAFGDDDGVAEDVFFGTVPKDRTGLTFLAADEDMQRTLRAWLEKGKLEKLAEAWITGLAIDWSRLHQGTAWQRLPLPTYPFAHRHYWLPDAEPLIPEGPVTSAPPATGSGEQQDGAWQRTRALTGDEWFLCDHIITGRPMVPAVVQLAWARAAAADFFGERDVRAFSLQQVSWPAPLCISAPSDVQLLFSGNGTDSWAFEIRQGATVCCRGTLQRGGVQAAERIDMQAIRAACSETCDPAELYAYFDTLGLAYGDGFRSIRSLHRTVGERALAQLSLPVDKAERDEPWSPSLLDGALQACIAVMAEQHTALPFALESIRSWSALPATLWACVQPAADDGPNLRKWDVTLCDENGQSLLRLSGFSLRATACAASLPLGETFLAPRWLPDEQAEQQEPWPAPFFMPFDRTDPDALDSWLAQQPKTAHLVWALPSAEAHQDLARSGLQLVKSLLRQGYGEQPLALTVITRQAVALWPGEQADAEQAALHGLLGSLSREYPHWRLRVLDLPATTALATVDWQSRPVDREGKAQAWRDGFWYRQALLPCTLRQPATGQTAFREGGVYLVLGGGGGIGTAFSEYLIRRYKAQLIWLGRRAEDATISAARERLSAYGPTPLYLRADGLDVESLELARMVVKERFGRLHGVVHGTIVLADAALATMDAARFDAAFQAKARTACNLDAVFGDEVLDFQLFFSSMQSFSTPAGQANYVAGCCYADALAGNLAAKRAYPVKVMHWGYWGSVGIVADDNYRQIMARAGFASIEVDEGMAALERFMHNPLNELVYARTLSARGVRALVGDRVPAERLELAAESSLRPLPHWRCDALVEPGLIQQALETRLSSLLYGLLAQHGWLDGDHPPSPRYARWHRTALALLPARDSAAEAIPDWATQWRAWSEYCARMRGNPVIGGQIELLEAVLPKISDILTERCPATAVMFPQGTLELVGKVYRGNAIADAFNEVLAARLQAYVEQCLSDDSHGPLRILEIGAGTGGTSVDLFARLQPFAGQVAEYAFTDLSAAFLLHAQEHFVEQAPYLRTARLDIERNPLAQGFEQASYDIVVATNVLHATRDIRRTLRHCKALLKDRGLLLLNELSASSVFMHLTFGLLDGWWLADDLDLRIAGTPALAPRTWQRVLAGEGFIDVDLPAERLHGLGQQVITAMSDGVLLVTAATVRQAAAPVQPEVRAALPAEPVAVPQQTDAIELDAELLKALSTLAAGHLKLPVGTLDANTPFSEFGFDSITLTSFTNLLNIRYRLSLGPTVLFEAPTLADLTRYLLREHRQAVADVLAPAAPAVAATAARTVAPDDLSERTAQLLCRSIAEHLKLPPETLDGDTPLSDFGFDSITLTSFGNLLNVRHRLALSPTVFFEAPTINALTAYLLRERAEQMAALFSATDTVSQLPAAALTSSEQEPAVRSRQPAKRNDPAPSRREPIAIIGMSGRFPGAADVATLWRNLQEGRESIGEIPQNRMGPGHRPDIPWAGIVDDIDCFDPMFFNISPREALAMDPQQRLLMQCVYHVIEDAGYSVKRLAGSRTALLVGACNTGYGRLLELAGEAVEGYSAAGISGSIVTNRMSYWLDWHGPSEPIDTACSSSLVAIHRAVELLRNGQCEQAVAGGVNLLLSASMHDSFARAGMLSPTGRCRTFSADADGYVRAEGIGLLLLKPLSAAERDGDHIYGLVVGSAENHGGRATSLTAPNPNAQAELIVEAIRDAAVDPATIGYIEAHGTATPLGDPIEIQGLRHAFRQLCADSALPAQSCGLGSVKSNLGHLELAAGVAGVFKVLLQLRHKTLVASLNSQPCNPHIDLHDTPFYVVSENRPWTAPADGQPRRAGVSSFGFGGVNAHLILEEYRDERPAERATGTAVIVPLSARNEERLRAQARRLLDHLRDESVNLDDLAYTLQVGREPMEQRIALIVRSQAELMEKLQQYLERPETLDNVYRGEAHSPSAGVALFAVDEDLQKALVSWLDKGKLSRLAELWVEGIELDWERLAKGTERRLSLPGYPFAEARYWVGSRHVQLSLPATTEGFHPLLQRNTSTLFEQCYSTTLTPDHWLLRDHVVQGTAIVPGVAQLEWARAAASLALGEALGERRISLEQVAWISPLTVDERLEVQLALTQQEDDRLAFTLREADGTRLFSRGFIRLDERGEPPRVDIAALAQNSRQTITKEALYQQLEQVYGLHYGDTFKLLEDIHVGEGQVVARLAQPSSSMREQYAWSPGLLDSALQASIRLTDSNELALPFALGSIEQWGPLPESARVVVLPAEDDSEAVRKWDIAIVDDDGVVALRFQRFCARLFRSAEAATTFLAVPFWQPAEAALPAAGAHTSASRLICCDCSVSAAVMTALGNERVVQLRAAGESDERYSRYIEQLLHALQRLAADTTTATQRLQLLVKDDAEGRLFQALASALRSAREEYAGLLGQLLVMDDLDGIADETLMSRLHREASSADAIVRYRRGVREVRQWRELEAPAQGRVWQDDGVYWITGGLGGLGLLLATAISERVERPVIILTGRHAADAHAAETLQRLRERGAVVETCCLDVTDERGMADLVARITEQHGGVNGILHCAGALQDRLLGNISDRDLAQVLQAKVAGVSVLDRVTRDLPIDWMVLCSSVVSVWGNVGQFAYAAGNGYLDQFACHRQALVERGERYGHCVSLNWPLWAEGGMQVDDETRSYLQRATGMTLLPSHAGVDALERALRLQAPQVVILHGHHEQLLQHLQATDAFAEPARAAGEASVSADRQESLAAQLERLLCEQVAAHLKLASAQVRVDTPFIKLGFDSVMLTSFSHALNEVLSLSLSPTVFFEAPNIRALAALLLQKHPGEMAARLMVSETPSSPASAPPVRDRLPATRLRQKPPSLPAASASAGEPIAVIGMSGRFPEAKDIEQLWRNLQDGRDCVGKLPEGRWGRSLKVTVEHAAVLDDIDCFDPLFFGISPREARAMDPQQRLLMEGVYQVLEDAGYSSQSLSGSDTALLVGMTPSGYGQLLAEAGEPVRGYSAAGVTSSMGPNRISYWLNWHGPSEPIDTACSSSLVAIHRAVELLRSGRCSQAVAGGVNLLLSAQIHESFAQAGMLSVDGRCRTFSAEANGYVRGEGIGLLLLKPLSAAERDGDHIYGLIVGSAENHGGKAASLTAPNPNAQARVIVEAVREANVAPESIGYIEAHGTGTPLGDPVEIQGLRQAFEQLRDEPGLLTSQRCALGSIKSNIGHLELAAGVAGVIKALLQLRHARRVPSLHATPLNSNIDLTGTAFYVVTENERWAAPRDAAGRVLPRCAGVSSFGFGGVNAHVLLQEYRARETVSTTASGPCLIPLSARTEQQLQARLEQLRDYLQGHEQVDLAALAYTLQTGRDPLEQRLVLIADDYAALLSALQSLCRGEQPVGTVLRGSCDSDPLPAPEADVLLQSWRSGEREQVARWWVEGHRIDWHRVYGAGHPRRLSLPTYPFARDRYWLSAGRAEPRRNVLHPLLHQNISTLEKVRFRTALDADDWFLRDHRVHGRPTVPGVVQLEWARAAVQLATGRDLGLCLEQVVWLRPLQVESALDVSISLSAASDGAIHYEIHAGDSAAELYSRGVARFDERTVATRPFHDIAGLQQRCTRQLSGTDLYVRQAANGLLHGRSLQGLQHLHLHDGGALAALHSDVDAADGLLWLPHLLDAALLACAGLHSENGLALPFAVQRVVAWQAPSSAVWAVIEPVSTAGDEAGCWNITLTDAGGQAVLRFEHFSIRNRAAATTVRPFLFAPVWRTQSLAE